MNSMLVAVCALLFFSSSAIAQGTCKANITATARSGGSWTADGVASQIYDITVANSGTCPITSLVGFFGFPATGSVSSAWNYDDTTGAISNFGGNLFPRQSFAGAGFILSGGVIPTLALNVPSCPAACVGSSTGASPTSASATTGAPHSSTGAATSTTGSPSSTCKANVTIAARHDAAFLINAIPSQIYDLDIVNTGSSSITNLVVTITPTGSTFVVQDNKWNIVLGSSNQYTVDLFGALSLSNAHFLGAGFVLSGTNSSTLTPAVSVLSVAC